jgi:DNA polymerase-3 subunit gamma/tau
VLDAVRSRRKVTWLLLADKVVVTAVTNGRVVLGFPEGGSLRGFASGGHDTVVREAIADVVGVDVQIEAVLAPGGTAAGASRGPASRGKGDGSGEAGGGAHPRAAKPATAAPSPAAVAGAPETPEGVDPEHDPVVADANVSATELLSRELGAVVVEQVDDA